MPMSRGNDYDNLTVPEGCPLTKKQYEVMILLCRGRTGHEISEDLGLGYSAVRSRIAFAFKRLGAVNANQGIGIMGSKGWLNWHEVQPEPPLAVSHPFLSAYLSEFDQWLASGMTDRRARDGMSIALMGARRRLRT